MISYGEGYKPLDYFKKNLDNISKSGGIVSVYEDYENYRKKRGKNVKSLTLEELKEFLKD